KQHLCGLSECLIIVKPVYGMAAAKLQKTIQPLLPETRNRLWLGLALSQYKNDITHQQVLQSVARHFAIPLVALGHIQMHKRSRQPLHDILTSIRNKVPLARCGYALKPNAEHHLRHRLQLARLYPQQALSQTLFIAEKCQFQLDELRYEYPDETVPAAMTVQHYLCQETWQGAQRRYPGGIPKHVKKQIQHELAIINKLQYEGYFLTVYDIVQFARSRGILCQGRGSAANSAVCYCLGITE